MRRSLLIVLAITLATACLHAVDGVVLINQSTVLTAGGFPFQITQPGSYKLSGNLVAPVNTNGIAITASNVTLDLNGFNVTCSVQLGSLAACIGLPFGPSPPFVHDVVIRNGNVLGSVVTGGPNTWFYALSGIFFPAGFANRITLDHLNIQVNGVDSGLGGPSDPSVSIVSVGQNALLQNNTFSLTPSSLAMHTSAAPLDVVCPDLVALNVLDIGGGTVNLSVHTCIVANNSGIN